MSGSSGFAQRSKRHGYANGARTLYEAVYQHIPPADQVLVKRWLREVEVWESGPLEEAEPPTATLADISKTSGA